MSLNVGGLWCPKCGDEYRPGFVECADCHVPLTVEEPDLQPAPDERDHEQVDYDLGDWTAGQVSAMQVLLGNNDVPNRWEDGQLTVPRTHEQLVDELIDEVDLDFPRSRVRGPASPFAAAGEGDHPAARPDLAAPGRRFVGHLVDSAVLGLLPIVWTGGLVEPGGVARIAMAVGVLLGAVHQIVGVARWGRTLGKVVVGTQVVTESADRRPSWRAAIIRWAVQAAFSFAAGAAPWAALAGFAIYGGVLWDPRRQGLHDRAAGTVVVVARPTNSRQ